MVHMNSTVRVLEEIFTVSILYYLEYSRSVPAAVAGFTETDEETLTAGSLDLAVKSPMSHT